MALKTDERITRDVLDELEWDPAVNLIDVSVTTNHRQVRLTGTSETYGARVAAEDAALRVYGVRSVENDIVVNPAARSDDAIRTDIMTALALDYQVPDTQISASVDHGRVMLTGQVQWNYQREAAFDDAFVVNGVKSVENLISLSQPEVYASDIQSRIARAFARHAELYDDNITVLVRNHQVTLDGTVETWSERDLAEDTAWMAPGVTSVVDNIDVLAP
ncbi:MAG: BON domain-containing protein [Ktedonobacterales bacterium]